MALKQREIDAIKGKIDNALGKFDLKLEQYRISLDERIACADLVQLDSNLVERETLEREKSEIFKVMRSRCALIESKVREVQKWIGSMEKMSIQENCSDDSSEILQMGPKMPRSEVVSRLERK